MIHYDNTTDLDPEDILNLQEKLKLYEAVLNNILSGVLITDPGGKVIFFSETYGHFLNMDPKTKIGKHCTEVIENTRMHVVAETGKPEINFPHRIMGRDMVVQRLPIWINGKLAAVFGQVIFEDVRDVEILAKRLSDLETKVELYEKELKDLRASKYSFRNIIGDSPAMIALRGQAVRAAKINAPILLVGESGTGKELFAHAIHRASERQDKAFIRINCSAIPKDLLESELFGYDPGAFTGAGNRGKPGKFELAHQGSIFLDEIGELPLDMQPKLLRVLEDKEVERLGGTKIMTCDFRLIAATHENLEDLVAQGKFRRDLFYRLNVIPLNIPSLRDRKEDIELTAYHFLRMINRDFGTNVTTISHEALALLKEYDWPGNVRELYNLLERILYSMNDTEEIIEMEHLPIFFSKTKSGKRRGNMVEMKKVKEESEKQAILHALSASKNNKNKAARMLGIHRTGLYKKLKKYDIRSS